MLAGGIGAQTSHVQLHTHASLFEHSEPVQVSKPQPIPTSAFVSFPKFQLLSLSLWLSSAVKNH
jgi:hypothetical protein